MRHIKSYSIALLALMGFTACQQGIDDNFEPGPAITASCQEVHFDSSNEATLLMSATSTERTASYLLTRKQSQGALTVELKVHSASEGVSIPQSVTFADGAATTTLNITLPQEVSVGTSYDFDVELLGDEVNPYIEGATRFSGSVAFPKVHSARMNFYNCDDLGYFQQDCYELGGGRLLFPDFLHSGTDVTLLYDASAEDYAAEGTIVTSPSLVTDDSDYAGCVMCYCWDESAPDDEEHNYGYTLFRPYGEGSVLTANYMCFYYGDGWTGFNPSTGYGWFGIMQVDFNIKSSTVYWTYLQFTLLDPAEDTYDYKEPDFGIQPPIGNDGSVLTMKAHLLYNDAELDPFEEVKATIGNDGTSLTFDDFQHSGISFTLSHGIDGTFRITSDYGYNQNGVWTFKNADGEWYTFWPSGKGAEPWGFTIGMYSTFNEWNVAERRITLSVPTIYAWGEEGDDNDRLILTW